MKLVMTFLVRNEDDILDYNIQFHKEQGVDFFIAMDHLSTDNTTNILKHYESLGILKRIEQTSETYNQGVWVTEMARLAYIEYGADWVINNDADEFWSPMDCTLKEFFEKLDSNVGLLRVNRWDYYYRPLENINFYNTMIFRECFYRWSKCCHKGASDVIVEIGNHGAQSKEISSKWSIDLKTNDILIRHFPIRSYKRYKDKMEQSGRWIWATPGVSYDSGFHWKNALQKIENGTFDEYFASFIYEKDKLNTGIKDGSIVVDDTIQQFFSEKTKHGH